MNIRGPLSRSAAFGKAHAARYRQIQRQSDSMMENPIRPRPLQVSERLLLAAGSPQRRSRCCPTPVQETLVDACRQGFESVNRNQFPQTTQNVAESARTRPVPPPLNRERIRLRRDECAGFKGQLKTQRGGFPLLAASLATRVLPDVPDTRPARRQSKRVSDTFIGLGVSIGV
jgi:hypothetical protein